MTFPERRAVVDRWPRLLVLPYVVSAALTVWLEWNFTRHLAPVGEIIAGYAGLAALALITSLGWTMWRSPTLAARRRARVLLWGVGIGYVLPLLGTSAEIVFGVTVPLPAPRVAAQLRLSRRRGVCHRPLPALRRPRGDAPGRGLFRGHRTRGLGLRRAAHRPRPLPRPAGCGGGARDELGRRCARRGGAHESGVRPRAHARGPPVLPRPLRCPALARERWPIR